jgi:hypothetical protein
MTYPLRPARTSQAEPVRPRVHRVASVPRPDGWVLDMAILVRPGDEPCIGIRTTNANGGGSRIQIGVSELDALEQAIAACRAAAGRREPERYIKRTNQTLHSELIKGDT